jgi:hypothetical protein
MLSPSPNRLLRMRILQLRMQALLLTLPGTEQPGGDVPFSYLLITQRSSFIGVVVAHSPKGIDGKQTVNPWVSMLLLIVISIHILLQGLISQHMARTTIVNLYAPTLSPLRLETISSPWTTGTHTDRLGGHKIFYVLSLVYGLVDIIGIGEGIGLGRAFDEDNYLNAILQAILGGSFLFVSVVELVKCELEKMRAFHLPVFPVFPVMVSLRIGYSLVTLIDKWECNVR